MRYRKFLSVVYNPVIEISGGCRGQCLEAIEEGASCYRVIIEEVGCKLVDCARCELRLEKGYDCHRAFTVVIR